jgi:hypothetical protein
MLPSESQDTTKQFGVNVVDFLLDSCEFSIYVIMHYAKKEGLTSSFQIVMPLMPSVLCFIYLFLEGLYFSFALKR